jgi:threonyl-tRNA synthetase
MSKIPYMLVVGEKEADTQTVSVRKHGGADLGSMSLAEFSAIITKETTF